MEFEAEIKKISLLYLYGFYLDASPIKTSRLTRQIIAEKYIDFATFPYTFKTCLVFYDYYNCSNC